jgi:hypothetical protein
MVGAGRVMLFNNEFKNGYGAIARFIIQGFSNYKCYNPAQAKGLNNPFSPFLRTFDAYEGHSV